MTLPTPTLQQPFLSVINIHDKTTDIVRQESGLDARYVRELKASTAMLPRDSHVLAQMWLALRRLSYWLVSALVVSHNPDCTLVERCLLVVLARCPQMKSSLRFNPRTRFRVYVMLGVHVSFVTPCDLVVPKYSDFRTRVW